MKRGFEIRHIECSLTMRRMKREKKYSLLILGIAILTCLLLQVAFQLSFGLRNTLIEYRRNIYGEWDRILLCADRSSRDAVNGNPFLAYKGEISIYGVLAGDYLENQQSNIGTMDRSALALGRIRLQDGRFPESETEIAMEASMLSALGYDCESAVGKDISLEILPSVSFPGDETARTCIYTLCGIIKDYQVNWDISTRHRLPTGIVTEEGARKIGSALQTHILIKAKPGKETVYKDLENSRNISCEIVENTTNTGNLITENIPYEQYLEHIRLLAAVAAICILFTVISHSVSTRKDSWELLHALGMERQQIYRMIFWEALLYACISVSAGTLCGILVYKAAVPVFRLITDYEFSRLISLRAALYGVSNCFLIIVISYSFSCMRIYTILKGGSDRRKKYKRKRSDSISSFTPLSITWHHWKHVPFRKALQIFLLSTAVLTVGFGILEIKERLHYMTIFRQSTGNGYFLNTDSSYGTAAAGISKSLVLTLSQIAGVDSVEPYYNSNTPSWNVDFTVDMTGYSDTRYMQEVLNTEQHFNQNAAMDRIHLNILGAERWEDMQRFTENLSDGIVTKDDFDRGDFCILLLSPLKKTAEGYLGSIAEDDIRDSFLTEHTIRTGDLLKIACRRSGADVLEKEIRVTGILRTLPDDALHSPLPGGSGISILAGSGFWKEFQIEAVEHSFQTVRVLVSEEARALDTEKHILRALRRYPAVTVNNYHQEYQQMQQEFYTFCGMFFVFASFYLIFVWVLLSRMLAAEAQDREKTTDILLALGMEPGLIRRIRRKDIELSVALSCTAGAVFLILYYLIIYKL